MLPATTTGLDLRWLPELPAGSFILVAPSQPVRYRGHWWRHREGGYTDGMSDPKLVQALFADGNPFGWHFPADVNHDGGYHGALEMQQADGTWQPFDLPKEEVDFLYREHLIQLAGMDESRLREIPFIYQAVNLGGGPAYTAGHAKPPLWQSS